MGLFLLSLSSVRQKGTRLPIPEAPVARARRAVLFKLCFVFGAACFRGNGGKGAGRWLGGFRGTAAFLYLKHTIKRDESQGGLCKFHGIHKSVRRNPALCTKVPPWKRFLRAAVQGGLPGMGKRRPEAALGEGGGRAATRRPGGAPPGSGGEGRRRGPGSGLPSPGRPPRCPSCRRGRPAATSWAREGPAAL